jgi:hypothetical protein
MGEALDVGLDGWSASAADGCRARVARDGAALRFDFALAGAAAFAIARRELAHALPAHYVVTLRLRGEAPALELQLKWVDPSGANVWWWRIPGFAPRREGATLTLRRASLAFAWGPRGGGEPERLGALELAVAAGEGAGSLWIESLRIEPREPAAGPLRAHAVRASSAAPACEPERALEDDPRTCWRPAADDAAPWLDLDLGAAREWGGLVVDFAGDGALPAARVLASDDGAAWRPLDASARDGGRRRFLRAGEAESRFVRLLLPAGAGGGIARIAPVPIELAVAPERHAAALARAAPRGSYPRHLLGEQAYWAVVSGEGDERKALLGEDGALEVAAEGFSVEPFLWLDGRLAGWADAESRASLADGCLPIPSVEWSAAGLRLRITAFVTEERALVARYRVENPGAAPRSARLFLALRPFQVTPAWQSLNLAGAVAPITQLAWEGDRIRVNDERTLYAVTRPDAFGAAPSEEGLRALREGRAPAREAVADPLGFAQGALAFDLRLPPGGGETIALALPAGAADETPAGLARADAAAWADAQLARATEHWRARLGAVPIALPPAAADFEASLRASLGWILVNREGPRIQPGPRTYRRSWIRDGALTGAALAEWGFAADARAFLRWYAPHQHADGRVPCAVDRHGVDATVEHDSHGQLAWAVVELFRLTGDRGFLEELWPHVAKAAEAILALREPGGGLLPPSISHEGYAGHPVHSYWDDFFALAGLAAAAEAAGRLGDPASEQRFRTQCEAMRRDVAASLARSMVRHGIDFVPGSAELGDFDPTSSAIAFDPCGAAALLPPGAAERTFGRWWQEREARRRGETASNRHSPYELRNAAALLALGWKARALALLEQAGEDQRPPGWRQWPEIVHRDPRAPRFLGDLPHGWIASTFLRSARRLFAWEREDGALVLAAGVPEAWLAAPGVRLRGLPTHFGPLDLALVASGDGGARVTLGGVRPPGGIVLISPLARPLREAIADGRAVPLREPDRVHLRGVPAEILLRSS